MKKSVSTKNDGLVEIPPFDFECSMPNKFAEQYDEHAETIIYTPEQKISVVLEPDVEAYFPDSESVNAALHALISAVSNMKTSRLSS